MSDVYGGHGPLEMQSMHIICVAYQCSCHATDALQRDSNSICACHSLKKLHLHFIHGAESGQTYLVQISIDEYAISHIKSMHHKQEDDAVKHGGNGALEDEAEGNNCCCHCCPQMRHIHLHKPLM